MSVRRMRFLGGMARLSEEDGRDCWLRRDVRWEDEISVRMGKIV
jgi:hypothetical protein